MGHRGGFNGQGVTDEPAHVPGAAPIDPRRFRGFRYLLGAPPAQARTTLGDDPAKARSVLQALHDLLPMGSLVDNPRIPAGYTYLLQFVAHDLVDTTVPLWVAAEAGVPSRNVRDETLGLDTLYGGGPTVCPIAFAPAGRMVDYSTQLRLGPISDAARLGLTGACPMRDIARLMQENPPPPSNVADAAQVYLADSRNDDNTVISQIAVLFSILHNAIAAKLTRFGPQACFAYASTAVTTMYHAVIARDMLAKLLHPGVYAVLKDRDADSKDWLWDGVGMPLEFSHGAFRIGHAMVRPFYQLNAGLRIQVSELLGGVMLGEAVKEPIPSTWVVEWARFFDLGGTPNYSLKLAIHQELPLDFDGLFAPIAAHSPSALSLRDWLSGANARTWRADALIEAVRPFFPNVTFMEQSAVRSWLGGLIARAPDGNAARATVEGALDLLATDLPLPLYVALEAQLDPAIDGTHMGPLGSVIVGEVIFRCLALRQRQMADSVTSAQQALGADWDKVQAVGSMPDLIRLAADWGGLADCPSLPFISATKS